ncbi:hypothetical protein [Martelella soudanensis]|uniref:hypothetical protein n=1 Tax=unclassified Martelella TaxID=2629616 RepID=UPI0015DEEF42|nr:MULTISPECIES: hypothetical protein [unclassified Martelella]
MGLFAILHHLVAPIVAFANLQEQISRQQRREENIKRIPPHLRQDILSDDRYWRHD